MPLSWYHSTTEAFFPDETHALIRRVYTHPSHSHAKRHFCGYCGTPLSYWSEEPHSEADYINLTLGSLLREDLRDLEDMGLIPDASDTDEQEKEEQGEGSGQQLSAGRQATSAAARPSRSTALRESYGVPWFDGLVEGTRLGKMRQTRGVERSQDGRVKIEWEVFEYHGGGDDDNNNDDDNHGDGDVEMGAPAPGKRKRGNTDVEAGASNERT